VKSRWNADAVGSLWPWYFDPSPALPYGRSTGLDIWKKLIWPIPHAVVERDRQARDVRELERQVALPARVHVARGRMDQEPQPPQAALAFEARHQVVRQLHPFQCLAQHELARVEDERLVVRDRQELGQAGLRLADVDVGVPVVAEDAEAPIKVEVDGARLEVDRIVRLDPHAPRLQLRPDVPVGQDAHRASSGSISRWAKSESTSRLSVARSSKLW